MIHFSSDDLLRTVESFVEDLDASDWRRRVGGLRVLIELIATSTSGITYKRDVNPDHSSAGRINDIIEGALPSIIACLDFGDEDVRFEAVLAVQELAKQGWPGFE
jgi:hypothetical protein